MKPLTIIAVAFAVAALLPGPASAQRVWRHGMVEAKSDAGFVFIIIINAANAFDTARMFVPVIVPKVLTTGLNSFVGFVERKVAPWQSEISGGDGS